MQAIADPASRGAARIFILLFNEELFTFVENFSLKGPDSSFPFHSSLLREVTCARESRARGCRRATPAKSFGQIFRRIPRCPDHSVTHPFRLPSNVLELDK